MSRARRTRDAGDMGERRTDGEETDEAGEERRTDGERQTEDAGDGGERTARPRAAGPEGAVRSGGVDTEADGPNTRPEEPRGGSQLSGRRP